MRYWLEYWCASRSEWLEFIGEDGRPVTSNRVDVTAMDAALLHGRGLAARVVDLDGRVMLEYV